jgi:predicted nucleotidyltransferase
MAVLLFGNGLRRDLLVYTFTHPDESYYVRELAGLLKVDAGNLSRELKRLEQEGLFRSAAKGNLKLYSLNKQYPLFTELKKIIFKTAGIVGSLKELVLKYPGVSFACIYGSYAGNKETKSSDVDLLLVGDFPKDRFTEQVRELESRLSREINFTSYSRSEFLNERKKSGGFLNLVLKKKLIILKGSLNVK